MKRLFMLRDAHNRPFMGIPSSSGPLCFENKMDAKERRDEVRDTFINERGVVPHEYDLHVSPGPDHYKYVPEKK